MSRAEALARRYGVDLDVERARDRTSAYVYGNILVLAAIATSTPESVDDGHAVLVVVATTVTTFLAHVLAHTVGGAIGRDLTRPRAQGEGAHELRDAVPIISSGSLPALVLAIGWLTSLDDGVAVLVSAVAVVLRLAGMGLLVARLSGYPPSGRQLWAGIGVALVSLVIVVLKVVLTH